MLLQLGRKEAERKSVKEVSSCKGPDAHVHKRQKGKNAAVMFKKQWDRQLE